MQSLAPAHVVSGPNLAPIKENWLQAAGIAEQDWQAADAIVNAESGWKPCAYYPHKNDCNAMPETACGLVQALPCNKLGSNWAEPVHALQWADSYVKGRYGGWQQALEFRRVNDWY